jgi:hypothetical protein
MSASDILWELLLGRILVAAGIFVGVIVLLFVLAFLYKKFVK